MRVVFIEENYMKNLRFPSVCEMNKDFLLRNCMKNLRFTVSPPS
jgi:hypothetical protein